MKSQVSAKGNLRSSVTWTEIDPLEGQIIYDASASETNGQFALCISDGGYPESLEARKFYRILPDPRAAQDGLIRVIDESGEDYLYSETMFLRVPLPQSVEAALLAT